MKQLIILVLTLLAFCGQDIPVKQGFIGSWDLSGDTALQQACSSHHLSLRSPWNGPDLSDDGDGGLNMQSRDYSSGFRCPQEHLTLDGSIASADPNQFCTLNDGGVLILVLSDQLALADDRHSIVETGSFLVTTDDDIHPLNDCTVSLTQTLHPPQTSTSCGGSLD